jgi:tetratricopeptide (TPR) repeat protein
LNDSDNKNILKIKVLIYKKNYDQAIEIVDEMIQKDKKNMELLLMKADICFKSDKMFECEEVFLYILKLKPNPLYSYSIFLRLGLTYLNRKSWEDAIIIFDRACEIRNNSSFGWFGLGVSNL